MCSQISFKCVHLSKVIFPYRLLISFFPPNVLDFPEYEQKRNLAFLLVAGSSCQLICTSMWTKNHQRYSFGGGCGSYLLCLLTNCGCTIHYLLHLIVISLDIYEWAFFLVDFFSFFSAYRWRGWTLLWRILRWRAYWVLEVWWNCQFQGWSVLSMLSTIVWSFLIWTSMSYEKFQK